MMVFHAVSVFYFYGFKYVLVNGRASVVHGWCIYIQLQYLSGLPSGHKQGGRYAITGVSSLFFFKV